VFIAIHLIISESTHALSSMICLKLKNGIPLILTLVNGQTTTSASDKVV